MEHPDPDFLTRGVLMPSPWRLHWPALVFGWLTSGEEAIVRSYAVHSQTKNVHQTGQADRAVLPQSDQLPIT